jgi:hypothetical protein
MMVLITVRMQEKLIKRMFILSLLQVVMTTITTHPEGILDQPSHQIYLVVVWLLSVPMKTVIVVIK